MKYSRTGHTDRKRHKDRIKRNGQARLVYVRWSGMTADIVMFRIMFEFLLLF